uniref:Wbp11/ELF5/Saf1 N-terminal domain-containing protein n=1 Tax=Paramormyrops kingsleyae TaxID=1676925 RepID=A0A3B3SG47_9TELE
MGRRSTSSTKSGKFMNPTDQARKEARKRELKKNKKQRMMVRAAVLKMKDPRQIIRDMEKLDEMVQMPQLNEKVLRDKRKKLRETFERIVRLYERENPETYKELRKLEIEYETKRGQLSLYFDSVKVWMWSTVQTQVRLSPFSLTFFPVLQCGKAVHLQLGTQYLIVVNGDVLTALSGQPFLPVDHVTVLQAEWVLRLCRP